jgi:hypothetical protein
MQGEFQYNRSADPIRVTKQTEHIHAHSWEKTSYMYVGKFVSVHR